MSATHPRSGFSWRIGPVPSSGGTPISVPRASTLQVTIDQTTLYKIGSATTVAANGDKCTALPQDAPHGQTVAAPNPPYTASKVQNASRVNIKVPDIAWQVYNTESTAAPGITVDLGAGRRGAWPALARARVRSMPTAACVPPVRGGRWRSPDPSPKPTPCTARPTKGDPDMNPSTRIAATLALGSLALHALSAWADLPDLVVSKVEYVGTARHGACNTARITVYNNNTTPVTADIPLLHAVSYGEGEALTSGTMAGGIGGKTAKTMQLSNVTLATWGLNQTYAVVDRAKTIAESNETNNQLMVVPTIGGHCAKLSVADVSAQEGKPLRFVVNLSPATDLPVSVDYAVSSSVAQSDRACGKGADYVAASGKLQFAKGETSKPVYVETCTDAVKEGLEGVTLTLSRASNAELGKATASGTITD